MKRAAYGHVSDDGDGNMIASFPDGMRWQLPVELLGAKDGGKGGKAIDKKDAIIAEADYDANFASSLTWVRKKIKNKQGEVVGTDEWLVLWSIPKVKSAENKTKQVVQLRNYKSREEAEKFMRQQFDDYISKKSNKDAIEDKKKVWLQTWGNEPKPKAKAKAKAPLKGKAKAKAKAKASVVAAV